MILIYGYPLFKRSFADATTEVVEQGQIQGLGERAAVENKKL